jgi:hypothetical protein
MRLDTAAGFSFRVNSFLAQRPRQKRIKEMVAREPKEQIM